MVELQFTGQVDVVPHELLLYWQFPLPPEIFDFSLSDNLTTFKLFKLNFFIFYLFNV